MNGHNPDILTCLANLSADEVFTPPKLANAMLDNLPQELFESPETTFLDPVCKSGVFLREIARRLNEGLKDKIPDEQARVDHILTRQVFGLAITELTSLISRRSLYCSKTANGKYSISTKFDRPDGNVRLPKSKHKWEGSKCVFCGAPKSVFERDSTLEEYAYPLIHGIDPKKEFNMHFDVIIGNPPYQLRGGAGGTSDSSIYHMFVEQAFKLEPQFAIFVIPSRWMAGGRGMDDFRREMLQSGHIKTLVDYTKMSTAFPGVDFEGGVGFFLWDKKHSGDCEYTLFQGDEKHPTISRDLGEYDIFIRDYRALSILAKVRKANELTMDRIISSDTPFGLATNFSDWSPKPFKGSIALHLTVRGKRQLGYVAEDLITKNSHLIDAWKVLIPEAYGERGAVPALVLGQPIVSGPKSACTQTYLVAGPFSSETAAKSMKSYMSTRFFRFLVSLRKITQHALRSTYCWVPQQKWNKKWNDELLYANYGLTKSEVSFIESMVRSFDGE